jgi:very-short-patch-repair endonuclease
VKSQYPLPGTSFVADFYLPSSNTVLEVNGPQHYIKKIENGKIVITDTLNGRTRVRQLKVNELGYKIVSLEYNFFNEH